MIPTDGVLKSRMLYGYCAGEMKNLPTLWTSFFWPPENGWGKRGRSERVDELWAPVTQTARLTWTDTRRAVWP
jgi:hypothetical protein